MYYNIIALYFQGRVSQLEKYGPLHVYELDSWLKFMAPDDVC